MTGRHIYSGPTGGGKTRQARMGADSIANAEICNCQHHRGRNFNRQQLRFVTSPGSLRVVRVMSIASNIIAAAA